MKYPYIGKCEENGLTVIFSDSASGTTIDEGKSDVAINGKFECGFNEREFKNITAEYLANTYGEVKSKEHAEFIVKLAEVNGIQAVNPWREGLLFCFYYNSDGNLILAFYPEKSAKSDGEKQITIPLPPESKDNDSLKENGDNLIFGDADKCKEWPCVGSKVTWGNKSVNGEVKAISDGLAWIKNDYDNYCTEYVSKLSKPKTPEQELRDELVELALSHMENKDHPIEANAYYLVSEIIEKHIKKPQ